METDSTQLPLFLQIGLLVYLLLVGLVLIASKGRTSVTARRYVIVLAILAGIMFFLAYRGTIFCDTSRSHCHPIDGLWYAWAPTALGLCVYALVHATRLAETTRAFALMVYGGLFLFPIAAFFAGMSVTTAVTLVVALFFDPIMDGMRKFLTKNPARAEYETSRSRIYQKYSKEYKATKKQCKREGDYRKTLANKKHKLKEERNTSLKELKEQFDINCRTTSTSSNKTGEL